MHDVFWIHSHFSLIPFNCLHSHLCAVTAVSFLTTVFTVFTVFDFWNPNVLITISLYLKHLSILRLLQVTPIQALLLLVVSLQVEGWGWGVGRLQSHRAKILLYSKPPIFWFHLKLLQVILNNHPILLFEVVAVHLFKQFWLNLPKLIKICMYARMICWSSQYNQMSRNEGLFNHTEGNNCHRKARKTLFGATKGSVQLWRHPKLIWSLHRSTGNKIPYLATWNWPFWEFNCSGERVKILAIMTSEPCAGGLHFFLGISLIKI